jgi:hypothetical protein
LLGFLITTLVEGAVSVPKHYPEEFRRKVLDLSAEGLPVQLAMRHAWLIDHIRAVHPRGSKSVVGQRHHRASHL